MSVEKLEEEPISRGEKEKINMSIDQYCSLCCAPCSKYKLLQNEIGENNELYEITVKHFDLLTDNGYTKDFTEKKVLCEECWLHIKDFHEFQQTIKKTRTQSEESVEKLEEEPIEHKDSKEEENLKTEKSDDNEDDDPPRKKIKRSYYDKKLNSISVESPDLDKFIAEWKPLLGCSLCSEHFSNFGLLKKHFKEKHTPKKCYVKCCGSGIFSSRRKLADHLRLHIYPEAFKCLLCGKYNLRIHKKNVHGVDF